MDLFLDTNIIIDHIGRRKPFYEMARKVCLLGITNEASLFVSVSMLTDVFYLLKKDYGSKRAQEMIGESLAFLNMVGISPEDTQEALTARWADFEDSLVARCAEKIKADYIITRNTKDFEKSTVRAITPEELFLILEDRGFTYDLIEF